MTMRNGPGPKVANCAGCSCLVSSAEDPGSLSEAAGMRVYKLVGWVDGRPYCPICYRGQPTKAKPKRATNRGTWRGL